MVAERNASVVHVVVIEPATVDAKRSARVLSTNAGHVTFAASSGDAGLELVRRVQPDAVVLDLEVSGPPGDVVLRHLQRRQFCPIIVVGPYGVDPASPTDPSVDRRRAPIVVPTPDIDQLLRIIDDVVEVYRASDGDSNSLQYGDLVLDLRYEQAFASGRRVPLAPRLFKLLAAMVLVGGQPVLVDELATAIGTTIDDVSHRRTLQDATSKLRHSLRRSGSEVGITWEDGAGYRVTKES